MKTMHKFSVLLAAGMLLASGLQAQTQREARQTAPFTGVHAGGAIAVVVSQGDVFDVSIETEASQLEYVETTVNRDILTLKYTGKQLRESITAYVTAPQFTSLTSSDAASFKGENTLTAPSLSLSGSGASSFNLAVETELLTTVLSGASNMSISGRATKHVASLSGASLIRSFNLDTDLTETVASGASNVQITASKSVSVLASGTSVVTFRGDPVNRTVKITGLANVNGESAAGEGDASSETEKVKIRIGQREVEVSESDDSKPNVQVKKKQTRTFRDNWAGLELGINGYVGSDNSTDLKGEAALLDLDYAKSMAVNLNLWQQNLVLVRGHLGFVTGIGVGWNNYRFAHKDISLEKGPNDLIIHTDGDLNFKKNKLTVTHLNVPLLLEVQTTPKYRTYNKFHLSAGLNVGLRISSHTKQMLFIEGERERFKEHKDFYLNPFRYEATARIGWGHVNLFASYALNSLFREGKGPELIPFTAGIRLVSF